MQAPTGGILALDIASTTGWAYGLPSGTPIWGVARFGGSDGLGPKGASYADWLADMVTVFQPRRIVFEAPLSGESARGIATTRLLLGLAFMTEVVCYRRDIRVAETNIMTVKKGFAGHGHASKADMIAECRRRGWAPKDDNAADALAVWAVTIDQLKLRAA